MSYEEAKVKYNHKVGLMDFAYNVYIGVIYDKEETTPVSIYLLNNTDNPISVAVDSGFFCEDLYSEGAGIVKTFEIPAQGIYKIDRYNDGGELDFTTYWHFYITDADKNLYCLFTSFSGRVFRNEEEIEKNKLEVFEFKDGKATEKLSDTEIGFRLNWHSTEKIKSNGKLLVPPIYDCSFKPREKQSVAKFLEEPEGDLDYLQKYGFI